MSLHKEWKFKKIGKERRRKRDLPEEKEEVANRRGDRKAAESGGQKWRRENLESFAGAPAAVKAMAVAAIENLRTLRTEKREL